MKLGKNIKKNFSEKTFLDPPLNVIKSVYNKVPQQLH